MNDYATFSVFHTILRHKVRLLDNVKVKVR
jgi:hypothetical protein